MRGSSDDAQPEEASGSDAAEGCDRLRSQPQGVGGQQHRGRGRSHVDVEAGRVGREPVVLGSRQVDADDGRRSWSSEHPGRHHPQEPELRGVGDRDDRLKPPVARARRGASRSQDDLEVRAGDRLVRHVPDDPPGEDRAEDRVVGVAHVAGGLPGSTARRQSASSLQSPSTSATYAARSVLGVAVGGSAATAAINVCRGGDAPGRIASASRWAAVRSLIGAYSAASSSCVRAAVMRYASTSSAASVLTPPARSSNSMALDGRRSPLVGPRADERVRQAYGIRLGPYFTIFTVPRLTGWAFGGATSETTPVLKFITKMSVDQRTPVWTNHETISILWPTGSAV